VRCRSLVVKLLFLGLARRLHQNTIVMADLHSALPSLCVLGIDRVDKTMILCMNEIDEPHRNGRFIWPSRVASSWHSRIQFVHLHMIVLAAAL